MKDFASYYKRSFFAVAILLGIALCIPAAIAQSGAGSIQGTVTDSTGAVIPGLPSTSSTRAPISRSIPRSNAVGFYQVPDLFTGTYVVTITAPGMKTYTDHRTAGGAERRHQRGHDDRRRHPASRRSTRTRCS